ncbi:hypothetical protein ANN_24462 [Periplaneta americana]|uniref:Uncharacterized protein n=1 Tax=Periplaneta americana TaxID=6978 RepID=A0ABQ8S3D3_PERAM|nr:hypothetical protein ANN_24462 [Periplaneta americana]
MDESRNSYRVLVGRPERKRPLGRPRRRWEDNIKMALREVGYDGRDWINLARDRGQWRAYMRAAMNLGFLKSQILSPLIRNLNSHPEITYITRLPKKAFQPPVYLNWIRRLPADFELRSGAGSIPA